MVNIDIVISVILFSPIGGGRLGSNTPLPPTQNTKLVRAASGKGIFVWNKTIHTKWSGQG